MLESQKEQIAQALEAYMATHTTSQNKVATASGVSAGYLSQILNRNWNAVPVAGGKTAVIGDQHFRKLQILLGLSLEVFQTKNYMDVLIALDETRKTAGATLIDGDTGAGKTFAITEYARQNPATVYVVKCSNAMTAASMIRRICEVVGVGLTGPVDGRILAVANKMNREGQALLVFDESETMVKKSRAFGFIKDLYDLVEGRSGIVIAGANGILDKLKVKASYNVESFPQVLRRFGATPVMLSAGIDLGDATEVCAAYGITGKRDVSTLVAACENYGTFFNKLKKLKADQELLAAAA
ncbi:ATP-binding protein [Hymenobacter sp. H14-R3]|uniref:ATP-binding protein n=1 Tax=Hymenobacter sp. H14-R3 TaxID=3046308 RepID=UPI0024B92747|nr:ATP-binding protein [Hymenobacter sp. H14-R3]MDJ0363598.1 ATP-binding protein [Hymenobacter sp. H14-R3]